MDSYLGFIEFFVVALFAMAWGVLELVGRRLDRKKEAERAKEQKPVAIVPISKPAASGTAASPAPEAS